MILCPKRLLLAALLLAGLLPSLAPAAPPTHTNSIGMEFALIPAGTFRMGSGSAAEECGRDEQPRREVMIAEAFYLGKHEVTQAQWEAVMGSNPSQFKGADRPVERVNWADAQASRHWGRPDIRYGNLGFRLALSIEE